MLRCFLFVSGPNIFHASSARYTPNRRVLPTLQRTVARTMLARLGFDVDVATSPADLLARPPAAVAAADVLLIAVGGGEADAGRAAVAELRRREAAGGGGRGRGLVVVGVAAAGLEGDMLHFESGCRRVGKGVALGVGQGSCVRLDLNMSWQS